MGNTPEEFKGRNDEALMSLRCDNLNALWKTHNTAIVELSQLGREVEKLTPPRPKLSHLKGSGSLEANADVVVLMYRADYYDKDNPKTATGEDARGLVELNVEKNRHGKMKPVYGRFMGQYSKFLPYESEFKSSDIDF